MYKMFRRILVNLKQSVKILCIVFTAMILLTMLSNSYPSNHFIPLKIGQREYFYVCPLMTGRLGNLMFVYASSYGIAANTGKKLIINATDLEDVFEGVESNNDTNLHCANLPQVHSRYHCAYDENMLKMHPKRNFQIGDYLQSYKYFENRQKEVRNMFQFKTSVRSEPRKYLASIAQDYLKKKNKTSLKFKDLRFIGVHIRRGDFSDEFYKQYGYLIADANYVRKAMTYMSQIYSNTIYVFASNDIPWASQNFRGDNVYFSPYSSPVSDMALLTLCNHTIITTGSFGWWTAYLTGGTTVYFKYPAREGSDLRKQFNDDYSDFFPSDWIGIS